MVDFPAYIHIPVNFPLRPCMLGGGGGGGTGREGEPGGRGREGWTNQVQTRVEELSMHSQSTLIVSNIL